MSDGEADAGHVGHRLRATSLRRRLVLTFSLVTAFTAITVAATSYFLVRRTMLAGATDSAVREARANLVDAASRLPDNPALADIEALTSRFQLRRGLHVVAVDANGSPVTSSISLSAESIPPALRRLVEAGRIAATRTVTGGRPYVVTGGRVQPNGPSIYFFSSLEDVAADLTALRQVLIGVGGILVLGSALVGATAAGGLLRPLRRARNAVHHLEAGLLGTRLTEQGRDEFADLARSFNRMAETLDASMAQLRHLEANHRRFVSDVSHELRTPLTALTTAADVLDANSDAMSEQGRRAARLMVVESRRLAALTEDLMEVSRLDAGVAPMEWELLDVGAFVADMLRARDWQDRTEAHLAEGIETYADRRRLDAVVANLVVNALEHGRPPVEVTVAASASGVEVTVSDWGEGIAPDYLPHVFERFFKADPARPRSAGSGLGLAIARENARLHDGDLTVTSEPGCGAIFTLRLPRRSAAPTEDEGGHVVAQNIAPPDQDGGSDRGGQDLPTAELRTSGT